MCSPRVITLLSHVSAQVLVLALSWLPGGLAAQTIEINGEIFRDPTQPPGAVLEDLQLGSFENVPRFSPGNFRVSFIRSGGLNPVAVINNRTVTTGDEMEAGVTISDIRPGAVVLSVDGEEHLLSLYTRPVRQEMQQMSQQTSAGR